MGLRGGVLCITLFFALALWPHVGGAELPATAPAATRSATQPADALFADILKAVELAQRSIRAPKPAPRPTRNTLQKQEAAKPPKDETLQRLAAPLVGREGSFAFRVNDVFKLHGIIKLDIPSAVHANAGPDDLIVEAECDNPTATYVTAAQRKRIQAYRDKNNEGAMADVRDSAEEHKPMHRLWIITEDPVVRNWEQGTRRTVHAKVLEASLRPELNEYVRATLVVRVDRLEK